MESKLSSTADQGRRKSAVITLRVPEDLMRQLKKGAAESRVTVNAMANLVLRQFFEWQVPATETGFISMHRDFLRAMVANMGPDELTRIGKEDMPNWIEQLAMSWYQSSSPDAILKTLVKRYESNLLIRLGVIREGDNYHITIRHDLGPNWSMIIETSINEVVTRFIHATPHSRRSRTMVTVTFKAPPELRSG